MLQPDQLIVHQPMERLTVPLSLDWPERERNCTAENLRFSVTSDLNAIENEWRKFEQRADCTPFQTFDWLATWQRCIGASLGVNPTIVLGRQGGGELLFILPLAIEQARFNRRLVFLGHALCDYNAPLLGAEFSGVVPATGFAAWWQSIRILLQQTAEYRHDVVVLDKMPARVGQQANPLMSLATMANPSGAYLTHLGADWDKFYVEKRSSATRRRDRTKRKNLAESGELRFVAAANPKDAQSALGILIDQKSRFFARMGIANLFARPGYSDFFLTVATKAGQLVQVSQLDVGTKCAATSLGLHFRGCYYHVLASYDDGLLARFGPGIVHLHELMRHAIEQGCKQFDFTIGDEPYKRDWADTKIKLYDHIAASCWRGEIAAAQMIFRLRVKRFIKQSRLLWPLVIQFRSLRGAIKSWINRKAAIRGGL